MKMEGDGYTPDRRSKGPILKKDEEGKIGLSSSRVSAEEYNSINEKRNQIKDAFFQQARQINEMMGVKKLIPYRIGSGLNPIPLIREGYFDNLTPEELQTELDNFEMEYLRYEYPEEFSRREQQQIEEARLRAQAMEPGKPEFAPPLEKLVSKTRENPSASVPIEVPKELRVGGRTRIL